MYYVAVKEKQSMTRSSCDAFRRIERIHVLKIITFGPYGAKRKMQTSCPRLLSKSICMLRFVVYECTWDHLFDNMDLMSFEMSQNRLWILVIFLFQSFT